MHLRVYYWPFPHYFSITIGSSSVPWNDYVWNYEAIKIVKWHLLTLLAVPLPHLSGLIKAPWLSLCWLSKFLLHYHHARIPFPNLLHGKKNDLDSSFFPPNLTSTSSELSREQSSSVLNSLHWLFFIWKIKSKSDPDTDSPITYHLLVLGSSELISTHSLGWVFLCFFYGWFRKLTFPWHDLFGSPAHCVDFCHSSVFPEDFPYLSACSEPLYPVSLFNMLITSLQHCLCYTFLYVSLLLPLYCELFETVRKRRILWEGKWEYDRIKSVSGQNFSKAKRSLT